MARAKFYDDRVYETKRRRDDFGGRSDAEEKISQRGDKAFSRVSDARVRNRCYAAFAERMSACADSVSKASAHFKEYADQRYRYEQLHDDEFDKHLCRRPSALFAHFVVERKADIVEYAYVKKTEQRDF